MLTRIWDCFCSCFCFTMMMVEAIRFYGSIPMDWSLSGIEEWLVGKENIRVEYLAFEPPLNVQGYPTQETINLCMRIASKIA